MNRGTVTRPLVPHPDHVGYCNCVVRGTICWPWERLTQATRSEQQAAAAWAKAQAKLTEARRDWLEHITDQQQAA